MNILSFDIGGTGIYYSLFNNSKVVIKNHINTRGKEKDDVVNLVCETYLELLQNYKMDVIGIASPGAIINKEYVKGLTGIKNYTDFNLGQELSAKGIKVPIFILNDANAACLAEFNELNKKINIKNMVSISIGTGIGGAIIINNQLFTGNEGLAGEFGYLIPLTKKNDVKNASQLSSSLSIERRYQEYSSIALTGKEIFEKYNEDNFATKAINEMVESLGRLIFNIIFTFNIKDIVLSGGITQNDLFIKLLKKEVKQVIKAYGTKVDFKIHIANHKMHASLQGAYIYAKEEIKNEQ